MRRTLLLIGGLALLGCGGRTEHEQLGDRRYAEGAYADALAEYRLATRQRRPSLELRAKRAAAALKAGQLEEAVQAWRELGQADPAARTEAAEGLARTARAAMDRRDVVALRAALGALRELSPARLAGLGQALLLALVPERADTSMLLEVAAGQSGDGLDSLVAMWGELMARAGRCDEAMRAFEGVSRRRSPAVVRRAANIGIANCGIEQGRVALASGDLEQAEARFREVVLIGVPDSTVRLAWVLLGDVKWAGGDTLTAVDAYRRAAAGGDDDNPIVQRALEQLRKLEGSHPAP